MVVYLTTGPKAFLNDVREYQTPLPRITRRMMATTAITNKMWIRLLPAMPAPSMPKKPKAQMIIKITATV